MPDKNVQLPDGRVVAFPDSMADADISAVIKKQFPPKAPEAPGVKPTSDPLADAFAATHWGAPMGSESEAAGNLPMIAASAASGAAGPEAGMLTRIIMGMFGAGAASPIKQKLQGKEITGKETAIDTATGAIPGAIEGVGTGLSNLKGALKEALFKSNGELTGLARAIVHPTELPESAMRGLFDVPAESTKAVPIRQSPNFDPAAYKAGVAQRTGLQGRPELFEAPQPSKIVQPGSAPPPINKTLVSYNRNLLVYMARGGDVEALKELIRNPGGINVEEAVPNAKYLLERGAKTNIYGGPK